jgi:hypothetical protein
MAKIPQGEWKAIAARYSGGEPISSIARHYRCTPPAIHYILKRIGQLSTDAVEAPALVERVPAPETASQGRPDDRRTGQSAPSITAKEDTMGEIHPIPLREHRSGKGDLRSAPPARPLQNGQMAIAAAERPLAAARVPALRAELDAELQAYAEAAMRAFRASFAAALAEGSLASREQLRQAAADLMRVAARTTIVLDRVNAGVKRSQFEATD